MDFVRSHFEKMKLWPVEHFWLVLIWKKSEPKLVRVSFFLVTFYKIHILGESNYLSHGILSDIRITVWHLHGSYGILLLFFCPDIAFGCTYSTDDRKSKWRPAMEWFMFARNQLDIKWCLRCGHLYRLLCLVLHICLFLWFKCMVEDPRFNMI